MATYYVDGAVGNDSNAGTSPGAGNAWATIDKFCSTGAAGDLCYVKASASYAITSTLTPPSPGLPNAKPTQVIGYTSVITDNGQATITTSSALNPMVAVNADVIWQNFILDGGNTAVIGISTGNRGAAVANCKVSKCTTTGIYSQSGANVVSCEVTNMKTGASYAFSANGGGIIGCYAHDSPGIGIDNAGGDSGGSIVKCIAANMTSHGISIGVSSNALGQHLVYGCTSYGNGGDGIRIDSSYEAASVLSNISYGNTGYGLNWVAWAANTVRGDVNFNAFGSNTSGARNQVTAGSNDVTLTASPFTNAVGGDFSLNNTAGGGAACRAVGLPGTFPGGTTVGYPDIGAAQHQCALGAVLDEDEGVTHTVRTTW